MSSLAIGPLLIAVVTAAIFVADTISPSEFPFGAFYALTVLVSALFYDARGIIITSAASAGLAFSSSLITGAALATDIPELFSIGATTYLALKIKSAEASARDARSQIAHVGRLSILGELSASIAHEVNQPLSAVVANANASLLWLEHAPPNLEEARQALARIVRDANRASAVMVRVRRLAKKRRTQDAFFDANEMINDTVALVRHDASQKGIRLRVQLAPELRPIFGDRIQLQQVVLNLIVNAIESMEAASGPRELQVGSAATPGGGTILTIADTGTGLGADALKHLFEPFFTTKPEGMGMGLTISRSLVEAHGGRIWASPNSPHGSIFHVLLPGGEKQRVRGDLLTLERRDASRPS
jgi:C4-dicarboxylate-specific signal transduction histidine kinase